MPHEELDTEYVSENYERRPGDYDTRYFWIAYPSHVGGVYAEEHDRISRAWGRGKTEAEALENARRRS